MGRFATSFRAAFNRWRHSIKPYPRLSVAVGLMAERVPYGSWSLTELKRELRKRGAKLDGSKHKLVERLNIADIVFICQLLI